MSNSITERTALAALCHARGWVVAECDSIRAALRQLQRSRPQTLILRHILPDGFSDQFLACSTSNHAWGAPWTIVLVAAGSSSAQEARQLMLGADCVLRDPIRTDVLLAYLAKSQAGLSATRTRPSVYPVAPVSFAGGLLQRSARLYCHRGRTITLTPREVELAGLLADSPGEVVTYDILYSEILNRLFRGDTSNMRVLLGKLTASTARVGISLRNWIRVIPKSGYIYEAKPTATGRARLRRPVRHRC